MDALLGDCELVMDFISPGKIVLMGIAVTIYGAVKDPLLFWLGIVLMGVGAFLWWRKD